MEHPAASRCAARRRQRKLFMLRFQTAGESHGQALLAFLSGLPAGLRVDFAYIDRDLKRRQGGYGRGGRMKIECDAAQFLSGVRHGHTIGSPITILIENRDWKNWSEAMAVEDRPETRAKYKPLSPPRPGHADLAGCLKFNFREARYVLERASARETAARVAAGALAKLFLKEFGIEVASHVVAVGDVALCQDNAPFEKVMALRDREDIVVRGYLKPISTLRQPLESVDFETKETVKAAYERSDVCVVPAGGVAGEAMVALVVARALLDKFGGDSLEETRRNFEAYREQVTRF